MGMSTLATAAAVLCAGDGCDWAAAEVGLPIDDAINANRLKTDNVSLFLKIASYVVQVRAGRRRTSLYTRKIPAVTPA